MTKDSRVSEFYAICMQKVEHVDLIVNIAVQGCPLSILSKFLPSSETATAPPQSIAPPLKKKSNAAASRERAFGGLEKRASETSAKATEKWLGKVKKGGAKGK